MKEHDIFWIKENVENGEFKFKEGVGASDNPIIFRYEDNYIVQADECLYMDESLEITKIDTDSAVKEIERVARELLKSDSLFTDIDKYISLEARIYIDCLFIDGMLTEIECEDYIIDREHYFMKNEEI